MQDVSVQQASPSPQKSIFTLCKDCGASHKVGAPHQLVFNNKRLKKYEDNDLEAMKLRVLPNGRIAYRLSKKYSHISTGYMKSDGSVTVRCGRSAGKQNEMKFQQNEL